MSQGMSQKMHENFSVAQFHYQMKKIKILTFLLIRFKMRLRLVDVKLHFLVISNTHKIKRNKMKPLIAIGYILFLVVSRTVFDPISTSF